MPFPTLFVSHGAPTFAIEPGIAGARLAELGGALGRPRAVLVVSPHWMTRGVRVTVGQAPGTIHDFGGFPPALYALRYPAPGAPVIGLRALELLRDAGFEAAPDPVRGLDHGAWVPLRHLFSRADIPVIQVSLPADSDPATALALGRALAPLAEEDVLVVGSGSITHNLTEFQPGTRRAADYAREFTEWIRDAVRTGDLGRLEHALERAPHAARAHPTTEHYLPLLVAAGAAQRLTPNTVVDGGIEHGVLAMDAYVFGREIALA